MKYWDISPPIQSQIGVFPGDKKFQRNVSMDFAQGDALVLSSINTTLHLGAHADGPIHYHPEGEGIGERNLSYYFGLCQVIKADAGAGERVGLKHLGRVEINSPRVLICTNSFPDPNNWNSDFNSLEPEFIEYLANKNVRLIGIDTPSIDPQDSKELPSHAAVFKNDLAILEGLVLSHISPGKYTLVALPLPISGADASPVRAVLFAAEDLFGKA